MPLQVVEPRIRGFVCLTAHPKGCAEEVRWQIAQVPRRPEAKGGTLLVVGASTGYGLASRIAGAFGHGMDSLGVFLERPPTDRRTASAGWYNTAAFSAEAAAAGLRAVNLNGDAFSTEILDAALNELDGMAPVDVFVYSVAAPRRSDPATGITHESVLKSVDAPFSIKTVDEKTLEVRDAVIEEATESEVAATVAVMGGADMRRWVDALLERNLLAPGARVVAYSYIGPEVTWPIYRDGTIGQAKADLERAAADIHSQLQSAIGGSCRISINKSVVTQASAAIPGVPLYMSLVFRVMKDLGLHEGPIEQMARLFDDHLAAGSAGPTDEAGRIRLDDLEMRPDVQAEAIGRWEQVTSENLLATSDYEGYQRYFRRLFGFDRPGVDYSRPVETDVSIPGVDA
jgi:enoyl-[acyl-carrier protein] reductase / trans-2-enoyl-CoA reductase (NAD+)